MATKRRKMKQTNYLHRISDNVLQRELSAAGAVLIEGAKWCGKTSTAHRAARSVLYMQDPDKAGTYRNIADTKPSLLLKGATPRQIGRAHV